MNINEKKEKLLNKEISISELSSDEVEILKKEVLKDVNEKKEELENLNKKIKQIKVKIDNWSN